MQFQLPEELQKKQMELREFLDKEIRPVADARDAQGPLSKQELKDLIQKLRPLGYVVGPFPREMGGLSQGYLERAVYAGELSRVWPGLAATVDTHSGCAAHIARMGSDEIRRKVIERAMEGDLIACDMMSEPQAGSDTTNFKCTAILEGDHYILNGQKIWQTNGPWADVGLLLAISDPEAYAKDPRQGTVNLFVEKTVSPWKVRDVPFIGLKAGMTGFFEFENLRVPKENLLAVTGYKENLIARGWARVLVAAWGLGIMQAALEDSIDWCKKRIAFGRPIGGLQLVQEMIADMATDLACSQMLTYRACELMDAGIRCDLEQNMAKAFATEVAKHVTDKAIQIHGARGLTTQEGFRLERYYRDAVTGQIAEGTPQIVRLVMGRRLLGISAIR